MTKKAKRICMVLLMLLVVLLIGCLVFTGKQLTDYPNDLEDCKKVIFKGNDDTMVAFTENGAWYNANENEVILLEITGYEEGVITMAKDRETYRFVLIDEDTLYDENAKRILTRRVSGNENS